MPACLKVVRINTLDNKKYDVPVLDPVTNDFSECSVVGVSGVEYQQVVSRILVLENESSTGESAVNVTADIFVGTALVCIFVLGWIAGAQR